MADARVTGEGPTSGANRLLPDRWKRTLADLANSGAAHEVFDQVAANPDAEHKIARLALTPDGAQLALQLLASWSGGRLAALISQHPSLLAIATSDTVAQAGARVAADALSQGLVPREWLDDLGKQDGFVTAFATARLHGGFTHLLRVEQTWRLADALPVAELSKPNFWTAALDGMLLQMVADRPIRQDFLAAGPQLNPETARHVSRLLKASSDLQIRRDFTQAAQQAPAFTPIDGDRDSHTVRTWGWAATGLASLRLAVLLGSLAATAAHVLVEFDTDGDDSPLELQSALTPQATGEVGSRLEPFAQSLQLFIDDEDNTDLDEVDENYLRTYLSNLRNYFQLIEGADPADIRRTVGKLVARLLELQTFGGEARKLLLELGGEPPEAVEEVITTLTGAIETLANEWALEPDPVDRDDETTLASITRPADLAEEAIRETDRLISRDRRQKFVDDVLSGAGKHVGKRIVDGALFGSGALAAALYARYGITVDQSLVELVRALPDLSRLFTTRRPIRARPALDAEHALPDQATGQPPTPG